ncbi:universal stress protein [Phyllobacterium sp. SB3]|uniref:universal stress protein n=1 Tax=Phyllobacterium sp. SB3 TaxID=3156073 RepID=UPI0032B01EB7
MTNVNTIIAALDLEAGSTAVLARAIQLSTAHAARLLLLHVIEAEPLTQIAALSDRRESDLRIELNRQAVRDIESLVSESGGKRLMDVQIEFGAPHEVINRIAGERIADLIVIGPGKRDSLKEKILGSTADRVIRGANAAVLLARRAPAQPYRQVMVAVDFSAQSAAAIKDARRLAPGASLKLVHAVDVPLGFTQAMLRIGTSRNEIERYRSARADKARRELLAFARDVVGVDKPDIRVLDGEPGPVLVQLSKVSRVDLVAIGPHGRGAVRQALLGSVTQRVLQQAFCDVLISGG